MPRPSTAAVLACALLIGCAGRDEVGVERQWGEAMARLGMFGIYPPSEDVQIGDLYLHAPPRDSRLRNVARFSLVRMASLPARRIDGRVTRDGVLEELAQQQAEDRLAIQALPGPAQGEQPRQGVTRQRTVAAGQSPADGRYQVGHADEALAPVRLRRAALPGLVVGRVTEASLGGGGTAGNFGAALGLGTQSRVAVELSLSDVQDMSIDTWRLSRMLRQHERRLAARARVEDLMLYLGQLRADLVPAACAGNAGRLAREEVNVIVLGRVLYAGGIEYSFDRSAETAMRLAIDLQSTLARQPQAPQVPTLPAATARPAATAAEPAAAAGERLAGLLGALTGETGGTGRAGITTRLGIGTFGRLSLKTDFARPIAVGAGSRLSLDFFQAMRGDYNTDGDERDSLGDRQLRYRIAVGLCRGAAPQQTDAQALAMLFGLDQDQAREAFERRPTLREPAEPVVSAPPGAGRSRPPAPVAEPAVAGARAPQLYFGPPSARP